MIRKQRKSFTFCPLLWWTNAGISFHEYKIISSPTSPSLKLIDIEVDLGLILKKKMKIKNYDAIS